jgi:Helix-turn-helix of DDE superfamily endonuclease
MLFYRAALPLSSRTLTYVTGIIRRHRLAAGSRWRKLNPGKQALLVLAYLRKGETFAELAAGFGGRRWADLVFGASSRDRTVPAASRGRGSPVTSEGHGHSSVLGRHGGVSGGERATGIEPA